MASRKLQIFVGVILIFILVFFLLMHQRKSFSDFSNLMQLKSEDSDISALPDQAKPTVLGNSVLNTKIPDSPDSTVPLEFSSDKLYSLINGYRRDHKLTALKAHQALQQSALLKLNDMNENHYWTHRDPQGRESWYLLEQLGYHFEKAGENLSFGYVSEWKVFAEWTKSPAHNAQLLEPDYEHMGLAVDCESYAQNTRNTCIVVLHLGKQKL